MWRCENTNLAVILYTTTRIRIQYNILLNYIADLCSAFCCPSKTPTDSKFCVYNSSFNIPAASRVENFPRMIKLNSVREFQVYSHFSITTTYSPRASAFHFSAWNLSHVLSVPSMSTSSCLARNNQSHGKGRIREIVRPASSSLIVCFVEPIDGNVQRLIFSLGFVQWLFVE